jgi:hypothetical protein
MAENLLKKMNEEQKLYYKISSKSVSKVKIHHEDAIYSLLYIIHYLEKHDYTLTHICLQDFVVIENKLFLDSSKHMVNIKGDYFSYQSIPKSGIEFITNNMSENRIHKSNVYESIGYFIYYLLLHKVKKELTEKDFEPIVGTKPYYFIKNAIEKSMIYI